MRITDLIIDPKSFGSKHWLVDVVPYYEYKNGVRTDNIQGYSYIIALPEKELDKVSVKIEGELIVEKPDGYVEVQFDSLEPYIYWSRGNYLVGARAKGIKVHGSKS